MGVHLSQSGRPEERRIGHPAAVTDAQVVDSDGDVPVGGEMVCEAVVAVSRWHSEIEVAAVDAVSR